MNPPLQAVRDELGRLVGRTLALGEGASLVLARLLSVLGVVVLGWVCYRVITGLVRRLLAPRAGEADDAARVQRARTLGPLLTSVARYAVAFVVGMLALEELGVDVAALAVSAGLAGLAIGFGAQSLIKDVITGFFMLFENLIAVGDVIEVGTHTGVVESVGLRVTKIRKFSGELRIVPNGELTAFGHHAAGWARAIVEVGVQHDQDVAGALRVLTEVGHGFREAHPALVLEAPVAEGILRFDAADIVLRLHARVAAPQKSPLELELRRRVKEGLDRAGIRMALPQMRVHVDAGYPSPVTGPDRKESVT